MLKFLLGLGALMRCSKSAETYNDNPPKSRFKMTWFDDIADSRPKNFLIKGVSLSM
ncbi:hypothetical protein X759_34570 [Mesorhizobium sp. LSHC420B00]|nr:hypothetical protein X759_34570 [Mesorhizobium sp. LSHC420B00]